MLKKSLFAILLSIVALTAFSQKLNVKVLNPGSCFRLFYEDMVISSPSAFSQLGKARANGACAGFKTPKVNYATHTLIFNMVVSDCRATFTTEVIKDDSAKVYRCITTITKSFCREVKLQSEWLLVPKLPAGYTVAFEEIVKK